MAHNDVRLQWRAANKRQREQYWIAPTAMVARAKVTLYDNNGSVEVTLEAVAAADHLLLHFDGPLSNNPESDWFDLSLSLPLAGIAQEQCKADDLFSTEMYLPALQAHGFQLCY